MKSQSATGLAFLFSISELSFHAVFGQAGSIRSPRNHPHRSGMGYGASLAQRKPVSTKPLNELPFDSEKTFI
jgi:hypothetical protein